MWADSRPLPGAGLGPGRVCTRGGPGVARGGSGAVEWVWGGRGPMLNMATMVKNADYDQRWNGGPYTQCSDISDGGRAGPGRAGPGLAIPRQQAPLPRPARGP